MAERQRTPDEIRREIEQTRADMDDKVQALGERVSPGMIIDQVWDRVKSGEAAASFGEVVKEHPLPSLLMGLGLGWLVYERSSMSDGAKLRRKYGDIGPGTYAPAEGRVGPYTGEQLGFTDPDAGFGEKARELLSGERMQEARGRASELTHRALEGVGDVSHRAQDTASELTHRAREKASELTHRARDTASELSQRGRDAMSRTYHEQPLALGAVTLGLGLASGLMMPSTRFEDEAIGRRADSLKQEVRRTGGETLESAKRVAKEAGNSARDLIEREGIVDEIKEKARRIAEEAEHAAREAADREGLNAEGLKNRARSAAESVRDPSSRS